jgi:ankyrin repeat protein
VVNTIVLWCLKSGETALLLAAENGYHQIVTALIYAGANVDGKNLVSQS